MAIYADRHGILRLVWAFTPAMGFDAVRACLLSLRANPPGVSKPQAARALHQRRLVADPSIADADINPACLHKSLPELRSDLKHWVAFQGVSCFL